MNNLTKTVSQLTVDDIAKHCEDSGITIKTLCDDLARLIKAKRVRYDKDGQECGKDDDNNVQLKALSVALELLRLVNTKTVEVSGVITHKAVSAYDVDKVETVFKDMMELRKRRNLDKIQQGIDSTADNAQEAIIVERA